MKKLQDLLKDFEIPDCWDRLPDSIKEALNQYKPEGFDLVLQFDQLSNVLDNCLKMHKFEDTPSKAAQGFSGYLVDMATCLVAVSVLTGVGTKPNPDIPPEHLGDHSFEIKMPDIQNRLATTFQHITQFTINQFLNGGSIMPTEEHHE